QKRKIQEILMRKSILDPYIDPKSFGTHDVYSIGVLLWEISSGRCLEDISLAEKYHKFQIAWRNRRGKQEF
ncbi:612_t:CDS:2, partial [Funneliformis mosseae]